MSYIGNSPQAEAIARVASALESAAGASEESSRLAREAAVAAKRSAFWTMITAVTSLLGIVFGAAINLGWFDWAKNG